MGKKSRGERAGGRLPPGDLAALILAAFRVVLPLLFILAAVAAGVVLLLTVLFR